MAADLSCHHSLFDLWPMGSHHFISYSSADAADFALKLCDDLTAGPPKLLAWLDRHELITAMTDWDEQIVEAICTGESLIFVMTRDSVATNAVCKQEWTSALSYKKPIILIRLHTDAETPFRLAPRQFIDFSSDFDRALAKLRKDIQSLSSPAGVLQRLKYRSKRNTTIASEADPPTALSTAMLVLSRVLRLFDAVADAAGVLKEVRAAAAGE